MKKDRERKVRKFVYAQQLPEAKVSNVTAVDHVTQVALETCRCSHLQEYLPHMLDLELCKASHHPRGWVVANPVHSLHLESQLEENAPPSQVGKLPPILYGEEQQRTDALHTEGIVEYWCPLDGYSAVIHDDTAIEKMEHLPTLTNVHKQRSHSVPNGTSPAKETASSEPVVSSPSKTSDSFKAAANPLTTTPAPAPSVTPTSDPTPATLPRPTAPDEKPKATPIGSKPEPASADLPRSNETGGPILPPKTGSSGEVKPAKTEKGSSGEVKPAETEKDKQPPVASSTATTPPPATDNANDTVETNTSDPPAPEKVKSADGVAGTENAVSSATKPLDTASSEAPRAEKVMPAFELHDELFKHLKLEEDRTRLIRRSLSSHRLSKKKAETKKKRKRESDLYKSTGIPGWRPSAPKELNSEQEEQWSSAVQLARTKVERWTENFRISRETFWKEMDTPKEENFSTFYMEMDSRKDSNDTAHRCCQLCKSGGTGLLTSLKKKRKKSKKPSKPRRTFQGDDLMQCLECPFVGCSPRSICGDSKKHILQHLLITGHKFAVTCGERAQVFCFGCGDFVSHDVFAQEKERIDFKYRLPLMAWKAHRVQRSFDPFHFMTTQDHGIVWRGLIATYPPLVPKEHFCASKLTWRRRALFRGHVQERWLMTLPNALTFAASQNLLCDTDKYKLAAPVGMYNLGNTCYKSAVLQCLLHCKPLQKYFLDEAGHHYKSCRVYREKEAATKKKKKRNVAVQKSGLVQNKKKMDSVCLACEMDHLFVSYYGNTIGKDVVSAIEETSRPLLSRTPVNDYEVEPNIIEKGDPLIISDMLTASWKSGGMDHLAGYDQRDAHEFLNSFLELMGKHTKQYRERIQASVNTVFKENLEKTKTCIDVAEQLFQGTLRSVLVCEACRGKRVLCEPFMNISLTLSEEVERMQTENDVTEKQITVESCLDHFVLPEKLGDSVDCPACKKKTSHLKQHTFSRLPKVLCLHLKRFDAARNRKIDEFVSFPARGLNMGPLLSHWCEVSSAPTNQDQSESTANPRLLYDLFGTVNHVGNMQSGHYVSNVKVGDQWYHCNDAHVSLAGEGNGEAAVLKNEGAYILFYIRR